MEIDIQWVVPETTSRVAKIDNERLLYLPA